MEQNIYKKNKLIIKKWEKEFQEKYERLPSKVK